MKTLFILTTLALALGCGTPPPAEAPAAPRPAVEPAVEEETQEVEAIEEVEEVEEAEEVEEVEDQDEDEEPYTIGGDVTAPKRISSASHEELHDLLRQRRFRGGVYVFRVVITREGRIDQIELLKPDEASPEIEEVLLRTLREYRFEPATRDGEPVAVHYYLSIHFCPR